MPSRRFFLGRPQRRCLRSAADSASNNNGSAFAGIGVGTTFYNTSLGLAMLVGRFLPIVFVLALAGSLARPRRTPSDR